MSEPGLRRPLLLALAGVTTLTIFYYTYQQLVRSEEPPQPQSLHRSNAVRRPRPSRRWRSGYTSRTLTRDPTALALENLQQRVDARHSYGEYQNEWVFSTPEAAIGIDRSLLPDNLDKMHALMCAQNPEFTPYHIDTLRAHLHAVFVQTFLQTEYPEGYIIGDDVKWLEGVLTSMGVQSEVIFLIAKEFDQGGSPMSEIWRPLAAPAEYQPTPAQTDGVNEDWSPRDVLQALHGEEDRDTEMSFDQAEKDDAGESQNMLDLLYHIAGEQARRDGYIHRGVECNSCGSCPIQGIRYHCSNCFDYDLCENCEAGQVHVKSHVFYKIRIPAPSRGHVKQVVPQWYPGNPNLFPLAVRKSVLRGLLETTGMDRTELDALYEQFKCLAGRSWDSDPAGLNMAIDRRGFDMYFVPTTRDRPTPANLIYDRIFAFYDTNQDGLIGFEEYIRGLANLQDKSRTARLTRIFKGYDLDGDGFVDRRDFLRMFRAYYTLSKELNREMFNNQDEMGYADGVLREVVQGSQPISAAFGGGVLPTHESRSGEDKQPDAYGDLVISSGSNGVLENDRAPHGDRADAIGNAALGNRPRNHPFRTFRTEPPADEPLLQPSMELVSILHADDATEDEITGPDPPLQLYGWPPLLSPEQCDIVQALGQDVDFDEIMDPVDRSRVYYAQAERLDSEYDDFIATTKETALRDRWRRRQFYLDEEEGLGKPPGYTEPDSSDDEAGPSAKREEVSSPASSRRQSLRSRSSSKVRFDDSAIDTDYETRSNASSKNVPVNERWGGYEFGQPEAEIGKEILYQAVQQGFNELLDSLFKKKEDDAVEALASKPLRDKWAGVISTYEEKMADAERKKEEALRRADMLRTEAMLGGENSDDHQDLPANVQSQGENGEASLDDFLEAILNHPHHVAETSNGNEGSGDIAFRDPTMPQFRPNEALTQTSKLKPKSHRIPRPPTRADLDKWLIHKAIDQEAEERGGYGKLDYTEFSRKMVLEDEDGKALDKADGVDADAPDFWASSAELGKLAFVGTWLEMASF